MFKIFNSPKFDSRIKSQDVTRKERWLGYFVGPGLIFTTNACVMGFINNYYTDVAQVSYLWGGAFLVLMPIIANILDAFTNIFMGRLIDKTATRQGKARPWILLSAPLLVISAILMYIIPKGSDAVKVIWIFFSYVLYDSVAYTIFNMSSLTTVPLSTTDTKQRDKLAMLYNVASNAVAGVFAAMLFPMVIMPILGIDQSKWLNCMIIISLITLPASLIQYFYTRERVTEYAMEHEQVEVVPMKQQLKACMATKEWRIIMLFVIAHCIFSSMVITGRLYYANWVVAGSYNEGSSVYSLLNIVGQSPLGFGIFLIWPLVSKIGKRKCLLFGAILMTISGVLGMMGYDSFYVVMAAMFIGAIGGLANTYLTNALISDSIDLVSQKNSVRVEGMTMAIYSFFGTVSAGIATGVLNLILAVGKYQAPVADADGIVRTVQTPQLKFMLACMVLGVLIIDGIIEIVLMLRYKEKQPEKAA